MPTDATTPYGELLETRMRILTWNVWWRLGPWRDRMPAISRTLKEADCDVIALQEVWEHEDDNQAALLATELGLEHVFAGDRVEDGIKQGVALLSRWPIVNSEARALPVPEGATPNNVALRADIDGPRGMFAVYVTHLAPYPHMSVVRQDQVRALVSFAAEGPHYSFPSVLCGDFNAAPDADELRLLTGRSAPAVPGYVFLDAWDTAGDASPGHTLSRTNPNWAALLMPDLRWDYILVSWPSGKGGAGHPVHARVVGAEPVDGTQPSDHYAVLAELRY